jgi:hypothetical protein
MDVISFIKEYVIININSNSNKYKINNKYGNNV